MDVPQNATNCLRIDKDESGFSSLPEWNIFVLSFHTTSLREMHQIYMCWEHNMLAKGG